MLLLTCFLADGEKIYSASLAAAAFVEDRPVDIVELCSNGAAVYRAVSTLMYKPSVMRQV